MYKCPKTNKAKSCKFMGTKDCGKETCARNKIKQSKEKFNKKSAYVKGEKDRKNSTVFSSHYVGLKKERVYG